MSDLEIIGPYDEETVSRAPRPHLPLSARQGHEAAPAPPASEPPDGGGESPTGQGPVPWKAAASSVPRLRQQPVSAPVAGDDPFPGFAQDAVAGPADPRSGQSLDAPPEPDEVVGAPDVSPLAANLPFWESWLERLRALPRPVVFGVAVVLVIAAVLVPLLRGRGEPGVSLARIRQQPEAFDGRTVEVSGKAGETFSIGGSYVFNLRQGRDTIVVYSRTRRPALHENVRAKGIVSIGYLDGVPRVALFEDAPTP